MAMRQNQLLNSPDVDKLVIIVEEATRATSDSPKRFIEPARGTLDRAKSRRHHLVFGRRGSGKTSLLRKAASDLSLKRVPIAIIDLEAFKGHTYPDVLLSVLIETLQSFSTWLSTAGLNPANKTSFWKRFFGTPTRPPLDRKRVDDVRKLVESEMGELKTLLYEEDKADLTKKTQVKKSASEHGEATVGASAGAGGVSIGAGATSGASSSIEADKELVEKLKRDKMAFLVRRIIDFQKIFEQISSLSESDAYVILDDLYHIVREDQAQVLDYFHRIVKGRSIWLKVGTIRHRTDWYHHGDPPIGLKLGDDADDIDLDITLEKYEMAKKFLLQILDALIKEAGLGGHGQLLADGGVERLVLASGGVARDFLTIFRKAVDVARERGETYRGERINAEDVNRAAGEHDSSKRDDLKRDTLEERSRLEAALQRIQDFCIENKVNCFLVERDSESEGQKVLGELVDLRFVHVADSRTTVRDIPGKLYTAYMLDISQYTGERRRREMRMVSFWKRDELDTIRRSKYVFDAALLRAGGF